MAVIRSAGAAVSVSLEKFLGLNQDRTGETSLAFGESPNMRNFRVTEGYKLKKREGYRTLAEGAGGGPVRGMWHGAVGENPERLYFVRDRTLFSAVRSEGEGGEEVWTAGEIGGFTADAPTEIFYFGGSLYFLNGAEYMKYDGESLAAVGGYRPAVRVSTPPGGGGTALEEANMLTGGKRQLFTPSGTLRTYHLAESGIDSVDFVKVGGSATSDYTCDLEDGTVTFTTAPAGAENSVEIGWTKAATADPGRIRKCGRALLYGGDNDIRVFFYGNPEEGNVRFYTGLAGAEPSAEYVPESNHSAVGSGEYHITALSKQFDYQIVYTEKELWYSRYETVRSEEGLLLASFPVYPLSGKGNVAAGQVRVVDNDPYSVAFDGVYRLRGTNVRDERNTVYWSKRVEASLQRSDLSSAVTADWERRGEYWLAVGGVVFVYNYRLDVWYCFDHIPASCFLEIGGELFFGGTDGAVRRFDENLSADDGEAFQSLWELSFTGFGSEWLTKNLERVWLFLKPESETSVSVAFITDRGGHDEEALLDYCFDYRRFTYSNLDYGAFVYSTEYYPLGFSFRAAPKRFTYLKAVLKNERPSEPLTILGMHFRMRGSGSAR